MAQYLLLLTRMKLEKEISTREPRLLRLLVCANLADMICSAHSAPTRHAVEEEHRHGWQRMLTGYESKRRTGIPAASLRAGNDQLHRTVHPYNIKSQQTFLRPQASANDRAVFRGSVDRRSEHVDDSPVELESDSDDSGPTYSDDDDDGDGSDYSSEDDTEHQP